MMEVNGLMLTENVLATDPFVFSSINITVSFETHFILCPVTAITL